MDALQILAKEVKRAGSQKQLAAELGISTQYLNDLLRGRRDFSDKVLKKLGLERRVVRRNGRSNGR